MNKICFKNYKSKPFIKKEGERLLYPYPCEIFSQVLLLHQESDSFLVDSFYLGLLLLPSGHIHSLINSASQHILLPSSLQKITKAASKGGWPGVSLKWESLG
jgi:hypothetical protein